MGVYMFRRAAVSLVCCIGLTASTPYAQQISLTGKVSNQGGKVISGAIVSLSGQRLIDTTDASGAYSLIGGTFIAYPSPITQSSEKISFNNGVFILSLSKPSVIGIEIFDIKGNLLEKVSDQATSTGDYRFDLSSRSFAANVMLIRVSMNRNVSTYRYVPLENNMHIISASATGFSNERNGLTKTIAVVDTLKVTASGYVSKAVAISSFTGTQNITMDSITLGKFSFFVTSLKGLQELSGSTNGFGGDLRFHHTGQGAGLLGADSICQCLAENSMPGSKVKIWHAFLSVGKDVNNKQVNAIDRIGSGPWYDRLGRLVGSTITDLQKSRPNADAAIKNDLPNEYGVPNHQPDPNQPAVDNHLTVTGSDSLGKLYSSTSTCQDWTSNTDTTSKPRSGLSWPRMGFGKTDKSTMGFFGNMTSWTSFWDLPGCVAGLDLDDKSGAGKPGDVIIGSGGGYGGFYCFALNP